MGFIFSYLKKYRWMIALNMTIKLLGTLGELMLPYVLEHIIDDVVPLQMVERIILWGVIMMLLALGVRFTNVTANRMSIKVARDATYAIRRDLFDKSINLSGSQMDEVGLPSLNSRMTSDSYNLQSFCQSIQTLGIRAPIMLIGGIVITMTMDVGLASILCIMAPIMIVAVVFISMKGIPLYDRVQKSLDDIVRIMRENITGIRVIKALSKEDYEMRRYDKANETMAKRDIKAGVVMALPGPIMQLMLNSGLTIVVVLGAIRVNNGVTQPGVILAFLTYFNMILMGVMGLNRVFMLMSKANASARRIASVVQMPETLNPVPQEQTVPQSKDGYIVFDHVSFSYGKEEEGFAPSADKKGGAGSADDLGKRLGKEDRFAGAQREKCLKDIDFSIKKGGSLGIIGATGCGKTTIINLLMRFYDADEGHVYVDGRDVRTYDKDELHRLFGVVFQNDVIFADTLKENITFGRKVSQEQMVAAAGDARAREFIEAYEDTYEHMAQIHGTNLSGGQRQRVLISRALAANPQILVLDDSSSALDYRTDAALRAAIRENHADATSIIVAQRISSIMYLDDILVMEEGEIIGHGTHQELLKSCALYREIYENQMGEER